MGQDGHWCHFTRPAITRVWDDEQHAQLNPQPNLTLANPTLPRLAPGMIKNRKEYKHRFHINWDTKGVREMARAMELAARISEAGGNGNAALRISQTYIPQHINREARRAIPSLAGGAEGAAALNGGANGAAGGKEGKEEGSEAEHVIHGS